MRHTMVSIHASGPDLSGSAAETRGLFAPWWIRVCAKLIDTTVVWGVFTLLWMAGEYFKGQGETRTSEIFFTLSWIQGAIGWTWVIYETGATGQSIGKRMMGTRIVGPQGRPVGFWHSLLHETLQLFVDMAPLCIGYLWPLVDAKRQTFSDKILGYRTYVLQDH